MINKKREIFIKLNNIKEIVEILENIKEMEEKIKLDFNSYDNLNDKENKIFEVWDSYLEDINQKLNYVVF